MNAYGYVVFNLTNKCNTVCRYCFQESTSDNNQFLPVETIKSCLDYCAPEADGKRFAQFTGGEMFLHPDVWEILQYAKNNGWVVRVQTNGLTIRHMTHEQLSFLSRSGVILKISLDGYDQETHEQLRAKGTFTRIMDGIEAIKPYKPRYCLKLVLTPRVANEFQKMLDLSLPIGVAGIAYNIMRSEGKGSDLTNAVDEFEFTERAIELFNQDRYRHLLNGSNVLGYWMMENHIGWKDRCFYVDYDGQVYPSQDTKPDECIGNANLGIECLDEDKLTPLVWEVPEDLFKLVKFRLKIKGVNPA